MSTLTSQKKIELLTARFLNGEKINVPEAASLGFDRLILKAVFDTFKPHMDFVRGYIKLEDQGDSDGHQTQQAYLAVLKRHDALGLYTQVLPIEAFQPGSAVTVLPGIRLFLTRRSEWLVLKRAHDKSPGEFFKVLADLTSMVDFIESKLPKEWTSLWHSRFNPRQYDSNVSLMIAEQLIEILQATKKALQDNVDSVEGSILKMVSRTGKVQSNWKPEPERGRRR